MNTKNKSLPDPEEIYDELVESGELDLQVISGGRTLVEEDQKQFDQDVKDHPPATND